MAKASWCSVDPASGTGNKTGVKVTGTEYTGRTARNTTLTVKTTTGSPTQTKTISVNQVATEQIQVTFESASVSALTTSVSFSGTSNSPKLTFDISNATIATLNVNGSSYTNGTAISGDPGASGFYEFSGTATLTRNETSADKIITLTVGGSSSSVTTSATMKQLKGTFEYKIVPVATKTSFGATGGTATVSCTYDTYLDGTKIYTGTELTGFNLSSNATSVATVSGVTITVVNNKSTSTKSATITVSKSGYTSATIALSQSAGAKVYATPVISTYTYDKRDAAGGTLTPNLIYSQVWTWNGIANSGDTISGSTSSPATGVTIAATIPTPVTGASVAAATGIVTWAANQGTERSVTVSLTITMNGKTSAAKTATATQLADAIDHYGDMVINTFTVNKIPAAGGTISQAASLAYVQKVYYVSGKITDITSGATVTYGTAVNATSLGTVVTNETSKGSLSVTVALNGKSATKTATVYQVANRVTKIVSDATFSYAKISPSATSASPSLNGKCTLTFTSGNTLLVSSVSDAPANTTMTATRAFTLAESKNGFTAVNATTGVLTATNMGKTLGSRTSATVTGTLVWKLTHDSSYGGAVVTSDNGVKTATCTQGDNVITYGVPTITKGAYASFAASENTKTPSATTYSQVGTYTSGSTDTYTNGGAIEYSMPNTTGFTLNSASTGSLTAAARGTTIGNPRSATITVKVTINGKSNTATITATQAGNYVTAVTPAAITLSYPDIAAGATSSTPTIGGGAVTYTFSSGSTSTTVPSATYGALTSANDYKLSASQNGFTAVNKTSGVLTATSRGTTEGDARTSGTITRTYTVTWTPTASYNSAGTKTGSKTATDTCTQALNKIVKVTIAGAASAGSVGAIPAKGGTVTWTPTVTYSSGTTSTDTSLFTPDYKVSGTGATQSGNVTTWANRTTTVGDARSATVTVSVTSSYTTTAITGTATTTQAANAITAYGDITIASLSYPNVVATGSTSTPAVGAVTQAVTYSSTSPGTITISARSYSIPVTTGASINFSTGVVTWAANNSTSSRSVTVTLTVTANNKTATKTATCTQSAGAKTYATPVVSAYSYATFAAAGATKTPTVSYSQTWGWNGATSGGGTITDSGGTLTFKAASSVDGCTLNSTSTGSISWASRGTTVGDARSAHSVLTVTVTMNGKTSAAKQCTACTQEANAITAYANPEILTFKYNAIVAAGGGTATPTLSYRQKRTYTSGSTDYITSGATVSYARAQLIKQIDPEFASGNNALNVYDNNSSDKTTISRITSGAPAGLPNNSGKCLKITNTGAGPSPGLGGFYTGVTGAAGETYICTFTAYVPTGHNVLFASNATGDDTTRIQLTPTAGTGGWYTYAYQVKYGTTGTLSSTFFFYLDGPAGSASAPLNWYVANCTTCKVTNVGTSGPAINASTGAVTLPSLGTTVQDARAIELGATKCTLTMNGKTVTFTLAPEQAANAATYGAVTVGTITAADIPASGGTRTATLGAGSQTVTYTSGSSRAGTVTTSQSAAVTVSSLGTTVKARTKVGSITGTWTGEGSKTATKAVDVYQAENKVTNSNYQPAISAYGTPTISIGSGITAAGGSATVTASVSNTESYKQLYSSGSTTSHTRSKAGTVTLKEQADNNGRFSLSGTTLSHSNMTTNLTTDTCTIRATNSDDSTKYKDASTSVQNTRSVKSTSGGVTTYGNVIAGTITNKTIPASGGEATATAGNGSQTWSKTAVVTTYEYTSGSTKDETTTDATSGTNTISPSVASITASAASKGKTESSTTTVKSQAVTWSGSGSKSASGTMYIYQAANTLTWGSWTLTCTANKYSTTSSPCPASGGTATISSSCTRSGSYTSGSTTSDSSTVTLSMAAATGATWNSTNKTVTWASRGTSASSSQRSVVVTATATAQSLSKTVTIYQAKNEIKSYTYGDYTGTLSLNSSSAMSAGADSRTVTFGYIRRSKTPVYDSGSSGTATTETWSGTAYLTIAVNSGSSYCTLSKSNYTNSSSTTTSTLTKSTYGTTVISAQTYTISLRQSSASGTVIASVTIKTTANAKTTITYGMPAITKTTPVTIAAAGSTVSIYAGATYSQTRKQNYTSLSQETLSNLTGNVADSSGKSCSVVTAKTGFTLTTSSGSLAVTNNTSTSARNGFVGRISLTLNGQSATKDITYNQSAGAKQYGTPTITFTIAATTISADGGTINVTAASVSRPYTWNGVSGSGGTDTAVPTLAINPAVTGCSITTSAVTISSHEGESERTIKCVASYSGATNVTRTITQAAAELGIGKMVIGSTFKVF